MQRRGQGSITDNHRGAERKGSENVNNLGVFGIRITGRSTDVCFGALHTLPCAYKFRAFHIDYQHTRQCRVTAGKREESRGERSKGFTSESPSHDISRWSNEAQGQFTEDISFVLIFCLEAVPHLPLFPCGFKLAGCMTRARETGITSRLRLYLVATGVNTEVVKHEEVMQVGKVERLALATARSGRKSPSLLLIMQCQLLAR